MESFNKQYKEVKCELRVSSRASISPNSTYKFPKPKNSSYYTLYEMIENIDESKMAINRFYKDTVNEKSLIILCSLQALYRHSNVYKTTGDYPHVDNDC